MISHLVAACLALHTLLGCCVHHAHAEHAHLGTACATCDDLPGHDHAQHEANDHDHAHHDVARGEHASVCADEIETATDEPAVAADEHDPHQAPCSGSCGDKCQFVATGRMQVESPVIVFNFTSTTDDIAATAYDASPVRSAAWLTAPPPPLPLRLHLWNGLLLI